MLNESYKMLLVIKRDKEDGQNKNPVNTHISIFSVPLSLSPLMGKMQPESKRVCC